MVWEDSELFNEPVVMISTKSNVLICNEEKDIYECAKFCNCTILIDLLRGRQLTIDSMLLIVHPGEEFLSASFDIFVMLSAGVKCQLALRSNQVFEAAKGTIDT